MRETILRYKASDPERFRRGTLWRQWTREYPCVFDNADVRLVAPRAPYGRLFGEWLAAAHYGDQGYRVLIGKYQFRKAHPVKNETFRRIAPKAVVDVLTPGGAFGRRQGPDLFVYSPDERQWFFAEVKGPRDTVSRKQKELFAEIERRSGGKDVVIVRVVCDDADHPSGAPNNALHRTWARLARSGR
jgi:VRR-NUC domain